MENLSIELPPAVAINGAAPQTQSNNEYESRKALAWNWYKNFLQLGNHRWAIKMFGDKSKPHFEHEWLFQVVDIVFVGAMFNVSWLIKNCGNYPIVFSTCGAYIVLMFTTRNAFDTYASISGAHGILHIIMFCFYLLAVFLMMLNIDATEEDGGHGFGHCRNNSIYNRAFAWAFITSRLVLIVMYTIYVTVFHKTNFIGCAPTSGKSLMLEDIVSRSELHETIQEVRRSSNHGSKSFGSRTSTSADQLSEHENVLFKVAAMESNRETVTAHYYLILKTKIAPMALSAALMSLIYATNSPMVVLPIVASVEIIGDLLPSLLARTAKEWKALCAHPLVSKERLGLFFMLVMGESIIGFNESHTRSVRSYQTIM